VLAFCDYWLDRKYLARLHHSSDVGAGVVRKRWSLMEQLAQTMSSEVSNNAEASWLSYRSDSVSNLCPSNTRAAKLNGLHQRLVGSLCQFSALLIHHSNAVSFSNIREVAILVAANSQRNHITVF
jgi:hypothetical protein